MPDEQPPDEPVPFAPPESPEADEEEFARIPASPAPRRSPVMALAVIAVAVVLLAHLAADTRYALHRGPVRDLGDARAVAEGTLTADVPVSVTGVPDFRDALLFEPKGDSYRRAFFPMLGTGARLLVRADETSTRHDLDGRFVGRLRRFDALPYAEQVRAYYKEKVRATRLLDVDSLRRALAPGAPPLREVVDRIGERIPVAAPVPAVTVVVNYPDEVLLSLPKDKFPVEEDARHEATRLGVWIGPGRETKDAYLYPARVPPVGRDAFLDGLEAKGFAFSAHREEIAQPLGALRTVGDELEMGALPSTGRDGVGVAQKGPVRVPWANVASVQLAAPILIPEEAWVVVENELPGDFTWTLALDGLLVFFVAFNLWRLTRSLVGGRNVGAAPAPPT
jgi:hypothetical protein